MKKLLLSLIAVSSIAMSATAYAGEGGSCHFHGNRPTTDAVVLDCAYQRKDAMVLNKRLDAAWKDIKHDKLEQIAGKKGTEWKLSFKNPQAKDKAQETLYMFYSLQGNYIAANYTGE